MLEDKRMPDERFGQISERVEEEVKKMTLEALVKEIESLRSNARFHNSLYAWLLGELRKLEVPNKVYWYLKEDLNDNMHKIVELLDLEDKFRERVIEYWTDQRLEDL